MFGIDRLCAKLSPDSSVHNKIMILVFLCGFLLMHRCIITHFSILTPSGLMRHFFKERVLYSCGSA